MERLEYLLVPLVIAIATVAFLLSAAAPETVVVVARVVGIILVVLFIAGFVARTIVKLKRARLEGDEPPPTPEA